MYISIWASQVALVVSNLPASEGDIREMGPIPGSGRSHGGGYGSLFQYYCLENPMVRGAWWATVHRATESDTTEASSTAYTFFHTHATFFISVYSFLRSYVRVYITLVSVCFASLFSSVCSPHIGIFSCFSFFYLLV